jgi:SAM-dependent methyltransferase
LREIFNYPDTDFITALSINQMRYVYSPRIIAAMHNLLRQILFLVEKSVERLSKKIKSKIDLENIDGIRELELLLKKIDDIDVVPKQSEWTQYYSGTKNELPVYTGTREGLNVLRRATSKHRLIDQILEKIEPETVLDIGCNRGPYSQMAALHGAIVVGMDTDEKALDLMYHDSKSMGTNVMPLFINAFAPAEAIGFKEKPFPSVTNRFQADCVLCLALIHHWVFKRAHMSFAHIVNVLSSYAKKYLIVEFVPKEDKYIKDWYSEEFGWYKCENFKNELYKIFSTIEEFKSFPSPRVILFCKK